MSGIYYQRNLIPSINYQGYNLQTINYRQLNINGINGYILNNSYYPQQQNINPNTSLGSSYNNLLFNHKNLNNLYSSLTFSKQNYGAIINSTPFNNRTNSANNFKRIGVGQLYSSGTLIISKKSRKENKVLKNGNEISNIDINNDNEENKKDGFRSVSTPSLIKDDYLLNKKDFKANNESFNSNNNNLGPNMEYQSLSNVNSLNNMDINGLSETTTEANDEEYTKLNPLARFFNKIIKKLTPSGAKSYNKQTIYENLEEGIQSANSLNTLNNSNQNIPINQNNASNKINNEINKNQTSENKKSEITKNNNPSSNSNYNMSKSQLTNQSSNKLSNNNKIQPNSNLSLYQSSEPSLNKMKIERNPTLTTNKSSQIQTPSLQKSLTLKSNKSLTTTDKVPNDNDKKNSNINLSKKNSETNKKEADSKSRQSGSKTSTSKFPFQKLNSISNRQNDRGFKYCHQLTQAGKNADGLLKVDQDTSLIMIGIGGIIGFNMFGVLDGHGPQGHLASQFCKDYFVKNIAQLIAILKQFKGINSAEGIYNDLKSNGFFFIIELFNLADSEIAAKRFFDPSLSGTTCNLVFQFNRHLVCFSVGDSRSIIVFDKGDSTNMGILPLSTDHKPDLPGEIDRIRLKGGEVDRLKDMFGNKIGPPRVFQLGSEYPGLAMSRSLGDFQAKQVGVIPSPQIIEYDINLSTKYLVICSDGVWEFASNEEVRNIGNLFYAKNDVVGYCNELVKYSMGLWEQNELVRDDITVVSVFF